MMKVKKLIIVLVINFLISCQYKCFHTDLNKVKIKPYISSRYHQSDTLSRANFLKDTITESLNGASSGSIRIICKIKNGESILIHRIDYIDSEFKVLMVHTQQNNKVGISSFPFMVDDFKSHEIRYLKIFYSLVRSKSKKVLQSRQIIYPLW